MTVQITATMVKELRQHTGAGMMECKKCLVEAAGDTEKAIELLRKSGQLKAVKRTGKVAAEGSVSITQDTQDQQHYLISEINCETDFVARDESFQAFVQETVDAILKQKPADIESLMQCSLAGGITVDKRCVDLVAKIGENIQVRRFQNIATRGDNVAAYVHSGRIAVLLDMEGGSAELAKDIAMHIAAMAPVCVDEDGVPQNLLESEKKIFVAQAQASGKPANVVEKIVDGKVRKFLEDITLLGQNFVKDPNKKIHQLLKENNANILAFYRYELGEGLEKKQENFADEVMEQVKQSAKA